MKKIIFWLVAVLIILVVGFFALNSYIYNEKQGDKTEILKSEPTDFARAGVITVNNPGQTQGVMHLVYEEPGAPALSKELVLDGLSICATSNGAMPCLAMSASFDGVFGGKRAVVEGTENGDKVLLRKLRILAENEEARFAEPGNIFILWYQAAELIRSCEIESVTQTHALDVFLTLKGGERVRAVEPNIDEVFRILQTAGNCGGIPIATE